MAVVDGRVQLEGLEAVDEDFLVGGGGGEEGQ